jgi:hypothetical protein
MRRIKSGWLVVALIVLAGCVWLAGPGSQSAAAQTAVRIFGTLSGAAKAVAVDSTGRLRVIIEGGGAAFDQAVTIVINAIGTTSARGLSVDNSTAAAAGAQQYSPMMCQEGQGWKTNATAGSQSVEFCWEVQPVQGAAAPTGNYILKASINGGAFSTVGTFSSAGAFTAAGSILGSTFQANATGNYAIANRLILSAPSSVDGNARFSSYGGGNTYDITLADWGTTMSAEGVSYANAGTGSLGTAPLGQIWVNIGEDSAICRFTLRGANNATVEHDDAGGHCSITKDNAATVNVYFDATGYFIQNNRGSTRTIRIVLIGA